MDGEESLLGRKECVRKGSSSDHSNLRDECVQVPKGLLSSYPGHDSSVLVGS